MQYKVTKPPRRTTAETFLLIKVLHKFPAASMLHPSEGKSTFKRSNVMRFTNNIGFILLAVYLILEGIAILTGVAIPAVLLGVLALVAGIFILIGR